MQTDPFPRAAAFGYGMALGAILALCYLTVYAVWFAGSALLRAPWLDIISAPWLDIISFMALFYLLGSVIGLVPAVLLGGVTTTLLAHLLAREARTGRLSTRKAMLLGAFLALLGSLLISGLFWLFTSEQHVGDQRVLYVFYIGAPAILYIAGSARAGRALLQRARTAHETAPTARHPSLSEQ
jgi:MFS family permease